MKRIYNIFWLGAMLALAPTFLAAGIIGPELQQKLATETGPFEVIVTFEDMADVSQISTVATNYLTLTTLPMAGAILTASQVQDVANWGFVESVYYNAPLEYLNFTSGEITGGHYVHDNLNVKGQGITVAVLDSGIDATHSDLSFGTKVVENVKVIGDLDAAGGTYLFLEGIPNTDTSSGHGTHVAGTVAGDGTASANDSRRANYYDGIAPEASLVGIGSGETLLVLNALAAMDYTIANRDRFNIDVISNSWGGGDGSEFDPDNPINKATYFAYTQGLVVAFAASNSGPAEDTLNQYAVAPWVLNVAAGTASKGLASFSSRGVAGHQWKLPDITAPGNLITSTRAVGTPIGALGPVTDPDHPEYYAAYHSISGTSMATPFVSGTVALMLEVNPNLSPDQIEDILKQTAEPMPDYQPHEVGAGYIDVRAAVELAQNTVGERPAFLAGDTKWSSTGFWATHEENDPLIEYAGCWKTKSSGNASNGSYREGSSRRGSSLLATFVGTAVKLGYPTNNKGGVAEVFIDGSSHGTISYYSSSAGNGVSAFGGLSNGMHTLEIIALNGNTNMDTLLVDGTLIDSSTTFVNQTLTYNGTMGPSAGTSTHNIPFNVGADVVVISAELSWTLVQDLDFFLLDPNGNQVASSATLANPEILSHSVTEPGVYTYQIVGFVSTLTDYTVESTLTSAVTE